MKPPHSKLRCIIEFCPAVLCTDFQKSWKPHSELWSILKKNKYLFFLRI